MTRVDYAISVTTEIEQAAELVAAAMVDDPGLAAILGGNGPQERRTALRFFKVAFSEMPGQLVSIRQGDQILGILRRNQWPACQLSAEEGRRVAPLLHEALGDRIFQLGERTRVWASQEPREPHWHLAPIAVDPAHQGKGVGSTLLDWFCGHADKDKLPAYLETSRIENVHLYQRFGFSVRSQATAVGVPHWFMWREPR